MRPEPLILKILELHGILPVATPLHSTGEARAAVHKVHTHLLGDLGVLDMSELAHVCRFVTTRVMLHGFLSGAVEWSGVVI